MISLAITIVADKVGKWRMQLLGCMLVLLAGLIFASPLSQNFWLLTTAATIGVVSPSGNEVGPFQVSQVSHACPALSVAETCAVLQALEQSMLAELVAPAARTAIFAWYNFVGYLATALGSAEAGRLVDFLQFKQQWTSVESCRAVFIQYSIIGSAMIAILIIAGLRQWLCLPKNEVPISDEALLQPLNIGSESPSEQSCTTGSYHQTLPSTAREEFHQKWGVSSKSVRLMMHLSLLFALDSFAGGLLTGEHFLCKRQHWWSTWRVIVCTCIQSCWKDLSKCLQPSAGTLLGSKLRCYGPATRTGWQRRHLAPNKQAGINDVYVPRS